MIKIFGILEILRYPGLILLEVSDFEPLCKSHIGILDQDKNIGRWAAYLLIFALVSERVKMNSINPNKSRTKVQATAACIRNKRHSNLYFEHKLLGLYDQRTA